MLVCEFLSFEALAVLRLANSDTFFFTTSRLRCFPASDINVFSRCFACFSWPWESFSILYFLQWQMQILLRYLVRQSLIPKLWYYPSSGPVVKFHCFFSILYFMSIVNCSIAICGCLKCSFSSWGSFRFCQTFERQLHAVPTKCRTKLIGVCSLSAKLSFPKVIAAFKAREGCEKVLIEKRRKVRGSS